MTTTTRHLSARDLEAVYDELLPKAIEVFNTEGELLPVMLVVSMSEEEGVIHAIDGIPEQLTMMLQRNGRTKDLLMAIVASLLHEESPVRKTLLEVGYLRPDVVVHMSEAWCLPSPGVPTDGSIADHPDKQEALLFNMHTAMGTTMQMLPVDPVSRQVTYSPFSGAQEAMQGRMQVAGWMQAQSGTTKH